MGALESLRNWLRAGERAAIVAPTATEARQARLDAVGSAQLGAEGSEAAVPKQEPCDHADGISVTCSVGRRCWRCGAQLDQPHTAIGSPEPTRLCGPKVLG